MKDKMEFEEAKKPQDTKIAGNLTEPVKDVAIEVKKQEKAAV